MDRQPALASVWSTTAIVFIAIIGCDFNRDDPFRDQPVVSLEDPPPALQGGTLLATRDDRYLVAADPDRDRITLVAMQDHSVRHLSVQQNSEPGRMAQDDEGRVYVVLRRGGALVELDPVGGSIRREISVCGHPQGVAVDREGDRLFVSCANGTLLTLDPTRNVSEERQIAPDLRDVVVHDGFVLVSRFREADIYRVPLTGDAVIRMELPMATLNGVDEEGDPTSLAQTYEPHVAVRLRASSEHPPAVLHQRARVGREVVFEGDPAPRRSYSYSNEPVSNGVETWHDPCDNGVVHAALTFLRDDGQPAHVAPPVQRAVVPVDMAVDSDGRVALAFAGEPGGDFAYGPQVVMTEEADARRGAASCVGNGSGPRYPGQVVSVEFVDGELAIQLREPAMLIVGDQEIPLGGASVRDTGHELFHLDLGGAVACASCHPGGDDDGHIWAFAATDTIRTLSLPGVVGLAPYHRRGDVPDFLSLMNSLEEQMASPDLSGPERDALESWLMRLPAPPAGPRVDPDAVARGREVFERDDLGCADCHSGEFGTDGLSHSMGGGSFQTPPLAGAALRAPYWHDGSANSLSDAVRAHPDASLGADELADLEAYLSSL